MVLLVFKNTSSAGFLLAQLSASSTVVGEIKTLAAVVKVSVSVAVPDGLRVPDMNEVLDSTDLDAGHFVGDGARNASSSSPDFKDHSSMSVVSIRFEATIWSL